MFGSFRIFVFLLQTSTGCEVVCCMALHNSFCSFTLQESSPVMVVLDEHEGTRNDFGGHVNDVTSSFSDPDTKTIGVQAPSLPLLPYGSLQDHCQRFYGFFTASPVWRCSKEGCRQVKRGCRKFIARCLQFGLMKRSNRQFWKISLMFGDIASYKISRDDHIIKSLVRDYNLVER